MLLPQRGAEGGLAGLDLRLSLRPELRDEARSENAVYRLVEGEVPEAGAEPGAVSNPAPCAKAAHAHSSAPANTGTPVRQRGAEDLDMPEG